MEYCQADLVGSQAFSRGLIQTRSRRSRENDQAVEVEAKTSRLLPVFREPVTKIDSSLIFFKRDIVRP